LHASSGSFAIFAAIRRASSCVSVFVIRVQNFTAELFLERKGRG
jgi:hypothetical protein